MKVENRTKKELLSSIHSLEAELKEAQQEAADNKTANIDDICDERDGLKREVEYLEEDLKTQKEENETLQIRLESIMGRIPHKEHCHAYNEIHPEMYSCTCGNAL